MDMVSEIFFAFLIGQVVDKDTGVIKPSAQRNSTLISRIRSAWKSVFSSRRAFESAPGEVNHSLPLTV